MSPGDDPLGRRALFGPPQSPAGAPATDGRAGGRRAFFSEPSPDAEEPAAATVRVICRACRQATELSPGRAARALLGTVWWPFGAWNHRMRCPACGQVGWCRVEWDGLIDWR
jgi:hypothetical protein